jgi:hypothetical protein
MSVEINNYDHASLWVVMCSKHKISLLKTDLKSNPVLDIGIVTLVGSDIKSHLNHQILKV